ncbi:MAG: helix-turn-helix transcriptional regulator [Planctomycetota bacterium]
MSDLRHPRIEDVRLTDVFKALSDPIRLEIVRVAAQRDQQPCNVFATWVPKSSATHHWRVLRDAGIIRSTKVGTQRLNSLRRQELETAFPGLLDAVLTSIDTERSRGDD